MENCDDDEIDREVNCVIDEILREDRLESMGFNRCADSCDPSTEKITIEDSNVNSCAVETSARFSIRILEALRAVQRKKSCHTRPSCTMEEVVEYIRRHYHHDGDLCSQVETALNQVTGQGFVLRIGMDRYHLMGPFAYTVIRPPINCSDQPARRSPERSSRCRRSRNCSRNCSRSQKRPERPMANSTFASSEDLGNHPSVDRSYLSASNVLDPLRQGGNNFEISFVNGPGEGEEFEEDRTVSVIEEVDPQARNEPGGRPGGNGCRGAVIQNHSSDDFMYCNEPVDQGRSRSRITLRGSRISESFSNSSSSSSSSSSNAGDLRPGRCPPPRRRRDPFDCSSDADISDEDDDETEPRFKPWIQRCQNRDSPRCNQKCASSACD